MLQDICPFSRPPTSIIRYIPREDISIPPKLPVVEQTWFPCWLVISAVQRNWEVLHFHLRYLHYDERLYVDQQNLKSCEWLRVEETIWSATDAMALIEQIDTKTSSKWWQNENGSIFFWNFWVVGHEGKYVDDQIVLLLVNRSMLF